MGSMKIIKNKKNGTINNKRNDLTKSECWNIILLLFISIMKQQRKKEKIEYKAKKNQPNNHLNEEESTKFVQKAKQKGNEQLPTIQDML